MIISAVARSGGTKFCLDKAEELNLKFVGQIDQISMPFYSNLDKINFHETDSQELLTFDKINSLVENDSEYVILNNAPNAALFKRSSHFLTRRDVEETFYSFFSLMKRQYPGYSLMNARHLCKAHAFQIGLFYSYIQMNNITPLYFEDLYPQSNTQHETKNSEEYRNLVKEFMTELRNSGINI